jgi:UDP-N-acetylmuramoyl-L-alanyl-D-glutamate--2,6-diaminopimelate ligase
MPMRAIKIKDILKGVKYHSTHSVAGVIVNGITDDSRAVKKGDLFIAVKGSARDGYAYIGEAVAGGAAAILAEREFDAPKNVAKILVKNGRKLVPLIASNFYKDPSAKLKIIGITGTNGKTTTTYIIEAILKAAGHDCGVIGTINYRYKDRIVPARNTTPGPIELQSLFSDMVKAGVRYVIMEASSHSLDQGRIEGIALNAAIFTNLTRDHLDYHKTLKNYFAAKMKIFDHLGKGGIAVLNHDDGKVRGAGTRIGAKVLTYGMLNGSTIRARDIRLCMDGSRFKVETPSGAFDVKTCLIGKHNISNILAGIAAAYGMGIETPKIVKAISGVRCAPGRLEAVCAGQPFKVFVDFAHTHDALLNILGLLREAAKDKKLVTVFGCGGNRDRTKRPLMGKVACEYSDRVIITSDNPRFEDPHDIIADIEAGTRGAFNNYDIVADRREAIEAALNNAAKDDIIVIAGKGHEKYQIIKDKVIPFDDCEVARSIIKGISES